MGATDPATKNELSRHLAAGYLLSNILKAEPAMDSMISLLLDWLNQHADAHKPIHLNDYFTYTTFDINGEVLFSQPFGFLREGKDIRGAIANSLVQAVYVAMMGYMQWLHLLLSNPFVTWLNVLPFGHIIDTAMGAIKEREKNPDARFDVVQHWFKYLAEHPERMHPREIQAAASNAVAAGTDTVATGLQAFVYYMIRRPALWKRARAEVEETLQRNYQGSSSRVVSYADAKDMVFLQACIKEALRIFGPAPMGLPRVAGKGGVTLGDRHFPEGTTISVSIWVMHHSKEIWGPDAREFRPERWLEGEKSSALERFYMPVSFHPWVPPRPPPLFFSSSFVFFAFAGQADLVSVANVVFGVLEVSLVLDTCLVRGKTLPGPNFPKFVPRSCAIMIFAKWTQTKSGSGKRTSRWLRTRGRAMSRSERMPCDRAVRMYMARGEFVFLKSARKEEGTGDHGDRRPSAWQQSRLQQSLLRFDKRAAWLSQ